MQSKIRSKGQSTLPVKANTMRKVYLAFNKKFILINKMTIVETNRVVQNVQSNRTETSQPQKNAPVQLNKNTSRHI